VTFHAGPGLGFPGMYEKVEQLKKMPNVYVLDQTTNQANPEAHMRWTGMVTRSVQI
jgi:cysteine synthase